MEVDSQIRIGRASVQEWKEYFARCLKISPDSLRERKSASLPLLDCSEYTSESEDELSASFEEFLKEAVATKKALAHQTSIEPESPQQIRSANNNNSKNESMELDNEKSPLQGSAESFCFPSMSEQSENESIMHPDDPSIYIGEPTLKEKLNFLKRRFRRADGTTFFSSDVDSSFEADLKDKRQKLINKMRQNNQQESMEEDL